MLLPKVRSRLSTNWHERTRKYGCGRAAFSRSKAKGQQRIFYMKSSTLNYTVSTGYRRK